MLKRVVVVSWGRRGGGVGGVEAAINETFGCKVIIIIIVNLEPLIHYCFFIENLLLLVL
jgi:hypothetical protein